MSPELVTQPCTKLDFFFFFFDTNKAFEHDKFEIFTVSLAGVSRVLLEMLLRITGRVQGAVDVSEWQKLGEKGAAEPWVSCGVRHSSLWVWCRSVGQGRAG